MAVATALAAPAAAFAQSAVQVYGTAHVSFNSTKYGEAANGVASVSKMTVASHASNFGIRSSETLGGGMTGWVQYEFNVKMERDSDVLGGNGSSRNTAIGLRGNWGNVFFGTWETPFAQTFRMWDVGTIGGWGPTTSVMYRREATTSAPSNNCGNVPAGANVVLTAGSIPTALCYHGDLGPAFGGSAVPGNYALWRRYGSAAFYDSPVFSGFQFKIGYQPNETRSISGAPVINNGPTGAVVTTTATEENPSSWSASLSWTGMGGKARAFIANMQAKDWTSIGHTDGGYIVGGGYNFGVVDVGAAYEAYTYKGATTDGKIKDYALGVAIPLGSGKIGLSYAVEADPKVGASTVDAGAKMYSLGYEWALSKRTAVGFGYAAIKNDPGAAFTWTGMAPTQNGVSITPYLGSDPSNIFVAFRHSF
jgi:predicted porin